MESMSFQEKQALAQSPLLPQFIRFLNECKTQIGSMIGKDEFETLVKTITTEKEAEMTFKFSQTLLDIKSGITYE